MPIEEQLVVGDVSLRVRRAGDLEGWPVLHFHGTPGSRLELAWGEQIAEANGIHLISLDRPGYGRSSESPFSLSSIAAMASNVADQLGLQHFATMGQSGGGPFALATAALCGARVSGAGVASGAGPFQHVGGALDHLSDIDQRAVSLLPDDLGEAAEVFASGFTGRDAFGDANALRDAFSGILSDRDRQLLRDDAVANALLIEIQEAFHQGNAGCGWDNVAWIGEWDFDVGAVTCPVLLWYGDEDRMAPPEHGEWLAEHLPNATLTIRHGYGHLGIFEHLGEMFAKLTPT